MVMSLLTDGSPYPILLPASKITKYSKVPDLPGNMKYSLNSRQAIYVTFPTGLQKRMGMES